jgi:predicted  nucleic acid-binding Zn-ribbon protein
MSSLQQALLALQAADTELEACRGRIRALQAELADETPVAAAHAALESARAEHAAGETAIRDGEQAIERLNRAIAALDKRLYDGSIHTAREAASVQEELAHRRSELSATEDAVLAAMERTESAQAAIVVAQERLAAAEHERARRVPALKAEGREVTARARALQQRRAALAAAVPADLLARYQRLHASHPPAVVAIQGGTCGGCGVAVPTAMQQKVAAGEILHCLSCSRLLADG